ncbi:Barstar (barnase inhibitor) [Thiothrix caldifontis]|uniref:Barstar (Barnase inhibitor) n=1 Tax=Thiothrix caldifontis TaxID=525918 RepID=A0A1H4EGT4_9GAMM|nr:barstar family protein [Thiothrix caldifontis]SEA84294.1 Barstar (barnase inhibitor) [Thiothrix caldifontis]
MNNFKFSENIESYLVSAKDIFISKIASGIKTRDELFTSLYNTLLLPGYFGFNWDALFDCLRDFHWIDEYLVIIVHEDLPTLSEEELRIYLHLLADACLDWKIDEEHKLEIVFPESVRCKVEHLLSAD